MKTATCAISFNKTLGEKASLLFLNVNLYTPGRRGLGAPKARNFSKNTSSDTNMLALTLWNKPLGFSSMNKISRITAVERAMLRLTPRVRSIIIGLILSDGWMQKKGHWNPRFALKQSVKNFPYLWYIYNELAYLCSGLLYESKSIKRGKLFHSWTLQTRQLECLIEIINLFYIFVDKKLVKSIKYELIFYMDYLVLSHWIQGDGSKHGKGLVLNTQSFTLKEVVLLINILIIKFDIQPTLQNDRGNYRICIKGKDLNKIKPYILPHFVNHCLYKIS